MIFDLREPPVGHPYHKTYLNKTLDSIVSSGIQHDKVRVHLTQHLLSASSATLCVIYILL